MRSSQRVRQRSFLILRDEVSTATQYTFKQAVHVFDARGMVNDADAQCRSFVYPGWRDQVITFELNTIAYQGIQAIDAIVIKPGWTIAKTQNR